MTPFRVRSARPGDQAAIASLLDRQFGDRSRQARERLWAWRHRENPAAGTMPDFLVLEREGDVVGVHGLMPLRLWLGDREVLSACSCDFVVADAGRGAGLQLKLRAMSPEWAPIAFSTSANSQANRLARALGAGQLAEAANSYVRPLQTAGMLRRIARRRGLGRWSGLAALAAPVLDGGLSLHRLATRPRRAPGLRVEVLHALDARVDALWQRVALRWPVQVVRDRAYLDWRYLRYPFPGVELSAAVERDRMLGLLATQPALEPDGERLLVILDLFDDGARDGVLDLLLEAALVRAAALGAETVVTKTVHPELRAALQRRGFLERRTGHSTVTYRTADAGYRNQLDHPSSWLLMPGDGDPWFSIPSER